MSAPNDVEWRDLAPQISGALDVVRTLWGRLSGAKASTDTVPAPALIAANATKSVVGVVPEGMELIRTEQRQQMEAAIASSDQKQRDAEARRQRVEGERSLALKKLKEAEDKLRDAPRAQEAALNRQRTDLQGTHEIEIANLKATAARLESENSSLSKSNASLSAEVQTLRSAPRTAARIGAEGEIDAHDYLQAKIGDWFQVERIGHVPHQMDLRITDIDGILDIRIDTKNQQQHLGKQGLAKFNENVDSIAGNTPKFCAAVLFQRSIILADNSGLPRKTYVRNNVRIYEIGSWSLPTLHRTVVEIFYERRDALLKAAEPSKPTPGVHELSTALGGSLELSAQLLHFLNQLAAAVATTRRCAYVFANEAVNAARNVSSKNAAIFDQRIVEALVPFLPEKVTGPKGTHQFERLLLPDAPLPTAELAIDFGIKKQSKKRPRYTATAASLFEPEPDDPSPKHAPALLTATAAPSAELAAGPPARDERKYETGPPAALPARPLARDERQYEHGPTAALATRPLAPHERQYEHGGFAPAHMRRRKRVQPAPFPFDIPAPPEPTVILLPPPSPK